MRWKKQIRRINLRFCTLPYSYKCLSPIIMYDIYIYINKSDDIRKKLLDFDDTGLIQGLAQTMGDGDNRTAFVRCLQGMYTTGFGICVKVGSTACFKEEQGV